MALHTIGMTYKTLANTIPFDAVNFATPGEVEELIYVPAGAVNQAASVEFLHAKVVCFCIAVVAQTAAQRSLGTFSKPTGGQLSVLVNSTSTPAPNLGTIIAGVPLIFAPNVVGSTNLFTADVTQFFISNPGVADLALYFTAGLNS